MENQFTPPPPPISNFPMRPKSWLVESILVTILCCLPFGIVGIINAAKVNSLYDQGLYEKSVKVSANAKRWTMFGFLIGIAYLIFVVIMYLTGGFSSMNLPGAEGLTF